MKSKVSLTAVIILSLTIVIFGPLVRAFKESKAKDIELKSANEKLSSGPIIRMDNIRLDNRYHQTEKIFEMRVRNDGSGTVTGKVFAVELQDKTGDRIERIDAPLELHWRGVNGDQKFFGDIFAFAGVLKIDTSDPSRTISLLAPRISIPLLVGAIEKYRNEEIFLVLRVVFYDSGNANIVATKERKISIRPDPASEIGYQISSV